MRKIFIEIVFFFGVKGIKSLSVYVSMALFGVLKKESLVSGG